MYALYSILLFFAQYFKVQHDYIFLWNTTVHHFVGKRGVGGGPIAFNGMKLHYRLPSVPFARNILKKNPTSDLGKNLEILSFPSFHLLFCLPGRTRHSRHIRRDEKKLSTAWSISRFKKLKKASKTGRERERERGRFTQSCIGVWMWLCEWGVVSCHFIISLLAVNPITFSLSFLSWKIVWVTGPIEAVLLR